jgi:hypothetical protein
MLTIKKLNNLYIFFMLFNLDENLKESSLDYITEKFDLFFNIPPNKDEKIYRNNKIIFNQGRVYSTRWGLNINDFINDRNFSKWLFTNCLCINYNKKNLSTIKQKYPGSNTQEIHIRTAMLTYNMFYDSYEHISENNNRHYIHPVLLKHIDKAHKSLRLIFRTVYLNQLTNKLKNEK